MEYPALFTTALLDLTHTTAAPLLEKVQYPWQALSEIGRAHV